MTNTITTPRPLHADLAALLLRLIFGGLFVYYGWMKISNYDKILPMFGDIIGIGSKLSFNLVIFAEFFCGIFVTLGPADFAELLVTEYPPGSVINWHRDAPPFDLIAGISLLSDCIFRLRPQEKARQTRSGTLSFPVQKRSLYVMQGESRSAWQHSISPVKETRYSITLRTLRSA